MRILKKNSGEKARGPLTWQKKGRKTMESMSILWQRIEQGFATHSPHLLDLLRPGASEEELLQAEEALGVPLPEDFKTFYRLHNGGCLLAPLGYSEHITLSLDQIGGIPREVVALARPGTKRDDGNDGTWPVQPFLWHPQRIPFLWGGYGSEFFALAKRAKRTS